METELMNQMKVKLNYKIFLTLKMVDKSKNYLFN